MGSDKSTLSAKDNEELYRPWTGLAAAITEHLALKLATIPAFEIDILCCYIAS
jgi:hypothetical protein